MKIFYFLFIFSIYSNDFKDLQEDYYSLGSIKNNYKTFLSNEFFLKKIYEENIFVTYYSIGKTHKGLEIPAIKITSPDDKDKIPILFNCAHHANELISTEHCYDIIYQILSDKNLNYLDYVSIWVVPIVNPDGSYNFWNKIDPGRKNGRGVDLNRNYPFMWGIGKGSSSNKQNETYRGTDPLSENESSSLSQLFEEQRFLFSVSYHSNGQKLLIPYTINNVKNPSEDYPNFFGQKVAKKINYKPVKNLYPVNGTDQDYFYFKYGTIAFLLESEKHNPPYSEVEGIVRRSEGLWRDIINEAIFGNKIFLKIVDEKNNPISAKVEIDEIKFYNGEEYFSSPITGLFYRMMLNNNYTVNISAPNYISQKFNIKTTRNNEIQIIKMKSN
jgi:hypothetical protein